MIHHWNNIVMDALKGNINHFKLKYWMFRITQNGIKYSSIKSNMFHRALKY